MLFFHTRYPSTLTRFEIYRSTLPLASSSCCLALRSNLPISALTPPTHNSDTWVIARRQTQCNYARSPERQAQGQLPAFLASAGAFACGSKPTTFGQCTTKSLPQLQIAPLADFARRVGMLKNGCLRSEVILFCVSLCKQSSTLPCGWSRERAVVSIAMWRMPSAFLGRNIVLRTFRCEQWLMTNLYFRTPHSVQAIQTEVLAVPPQILLDLHSSDSAGDIR